MRGKRRKRKYIYDRGARALAVTFALCLAVPAIATFFADAEERMRWENRPLAELPSISKLTADRNFFGEMDDYLNDHFGLALKMNRLYRRVLFYVFQDSPTPTVTLGTDGFVFLNSHNPGSRFEAFQNVCINNVRQDRIEFAQRAWSKTFDFFTPGIDRVALLIPLSKPTLYAEKFPLDVPRKYREACRQFRSKKNAASELSAWGEASGNVVVYPVNEFHAQRFENNFYPRERFHFSGMSAHTFARIALGKLGINISEAYDFHEPIDTVTSDLGSLIGFNRPLRVDYFPYAEFELHKQEGVPAFVKEYYQKIKQFGVVTSGSPMTERAALVITDSFGKSAVNHLAPGYRSITWINIANLAEGETVRFFTEFVERIDPDDLLFIFHDGLAASRPALWVDALDRYQRLH